MMADGERKGERGGLGEGEEVRWGSGPSRGEKLSKVQAFFT